MERERADVIQRAELLQEQVTRKQREAGLLIWIALRTPYHVGVEVSSFQPDRIRLRTT